MGKRGSGWVTWSCLKKICPLFFFWPGCYNIPMIFTILLNQLNLLLFDFSSISWKVPSSSINSLNCCKTWYSLITSRFSSKLGSLLFTQMLYLLWMVEYRACQYHFLSMNFFTNNLALHMTILLHNPREKIQYQTSFSSLAINEFCLKLIEFYEIVFVPTNLNWLSLYNVNSTFLSLGISI